MEKKTKKNKTDEDRFSSTLCAYLSFFRSSVYFLLCTICTKEKNIVLRFCMDGASLVLCSFLCLFSKREIAHFFCCCYYYCCCFSSSSLLSKRYQKAFSPFRFSRFFFSFYTRYVRILIEKKRYKKRLFSLSLFLTSIEHSSSHNYSLSLVLSFSSK